MNKLVFEKKTEDLEHSDIDRKFTWLQALRHIADLNRKKIENADNWRVPTIDEMYSYIDGLKVAHNDYYVELAARMWYWIILEGGIPWSVTLYSKQRRPIRYTDKCRIIAVRDVMRALVPKLYL